MSTSSRDRGRVEKVVAWFKSLGPSTMQDMYNLLTGAGEITVPNDAEPSEGGQTLAEFSSACSQAAKLGLLDDDEKVPSPKGKGHERSIYKYLEVPREPRLSASEIIIQDLQAYVALLEKRNEFLEQFAPKTDAAQTQEGAVVGPPASTG